MLRYQLINGGVVAMLNDEIFIILANDSLIPQTKIFFLKIFEPLIFNELLRSINELETRASRENCEVYCIFHNSLMVACAQIDWYNDYAHINLFGILKEFRGHGIPKKFILWLEKHCLELNKSRIEFDTLEDWQTRHYFYLRLGFTKGSEFHRDNIQFRKFIKEIKS